MQYDYFYKRDLERFQFFMLPKILVTGEDFKDLSSDAKILYACLIERHALSAKNNWVDDQDRIYIIFTIKELMKTLNIANSTASKVLAELEKIGLIERKRQYLGKPTLIYVKDFMAPSGHKCKNDTTVIGNSHHSDWKSASPVTGNSRHSDWKSASPVTGNSHASNTNNSNTDISNTKNSLGSTPKFLGKFKNVKLEEKEVEELKEFIPSYLVNDYIEKRQKTRVLSLVAEMSLKCRSEKKACSQAVPVLSRFFLIFGTRHLKGGVVVAPPFFAHLAQIS